MSERLCGITIIPIADSTSQETIGTLGFPREPPFLWDTLSLGPSSVNQPVSWCIKSKILAPFAPFLPLLAMIHTFYSLLFHNSLGLSPGKAGKRGCSIAGYIRVIGILLRAECFPFASEQISGHERESSEKSLFPAHELFSSAHCSRVFFISIPLIIQEPFTTGKADAALITDSVKGHFE